MALINCPDCGTQVSENAVSCPKCASPIAGKQSKTLTEQSAKKYKLIRLAGIVVLLASVAIGIIGADEYGAAEGFNTIAAGIGLAVGIILLIVGNALTWWHHG
jgi:uncharacterized paraquat-inducible protein A